MNMIRKGPNTRLASTPGRRSTSRSSLPVNEPIRMRLSMRLRTVGPRSRWRTVLLAPAVRGAAPLHESGEDLVERRLVLLDADDVDPGAAQGVDDRRRERLRL